MMTESLFKEICQRAMLKSIMAFSKFIGCPLEVKKTDLNILEKNKIHLDSSFQGNIVNVHIPITGFFCGSASIFLPEKSASYVCDYLLKRKITSTTSLNELEISAITESGNILVGNFLTYFSQALQTNLLMHPVALFDNDDSNIIFQKTQENINKNFKEQIIQIKSNISHDDMNMKLIYFFDNKKIKYHLSQLINTQAMIS